ncbi:MAG TPA: 30S ribosomal protein S20 [Pseudomonadales bacterium]
MANSAQARKRARQAETHRQHNASLRSRTRTSIKKVIAAIRSGDKEQAKMALQSATPIVDGMVNKGLIHRNKAARHKSRLSARIKAMA